MLVQVICSMLRMGDGRSGEYQFVKEMGKDVGSDVGELWLRFS